LVPAINASVEPAKSGSRAFAHAVGTHLGGGLEVSKGAEFTARDATVDDHVIDDLVAVVVDAVAKLWGRCVDVGITVVAVGSHAAATFAVDVAIPVNAADAVVRDTLLNDGTVIDAADQPAGEPDGANVWIVCAVDYAKVPAGEWGADIERVTTFGTAGAGLAERVRCRETGVLGPRFCFDGDANKLGAASPLRARLHTNTSPLSFGNDAEIFAVRVF
jgi:hypothetical protein